MTNEQLASQVTWSRSFVTSDRMSIDPSKERMHEAIVMLAGRLDRAIELIRRSGEAPYAEARAARALLAEVDK